MAPILLEICCGSAEDALQASLGGADRVELCSALFLGGLTPSLGSLELLKKQAFRPSIMAMVRPRAGDFCYSKTEMDVMERDVELFLQHGVDGVVFGILHEDGTVDLERSRRVRDLVGDREAVFHRAFDVVPDPIRALDELIELNFTRVLTSGQQPTSPQGAALIRKLVQHARGRIEILPGAGIRTGNVAQLIAETGCTQVHTTAFRQLEDSSTAASAIQFGSPHNPSESSYDLTDNNLVQQMRTTLDGLWPRRTESDC
jgi:copper homeostasis protein